MAFNRNPKRRERYKMLKELGFSAFEATYLKDRHDDFIAKCIEDLKDIGQPFDIKVARINRIKKLADQFK